MACDIPGVKVEEKTPLPPSVEGVATAVPAFIGFTAMAAMAAAGDLLNQPTRVVSMLEYEHHFGKAQNETAIAVAFATDKHGVPTSAIATIDESKRSKYLMWYALRLYFDNGGGPCYVCSAGNYAASGAVDADALMAGLLAVGETEGPTLLVFPEAQRLAARDYLALHHAALQQCADLKDRFVVMDLSGKATTVAGTDDPANDVDVDAVDSDIAKAASNFRAFCTDTENLQYGAVYFPNLATTLPFAFAATQVNVTGIAGCSHLSDLKDGSVAQTHELALAAIGKLVCKLPPGGAVAGIYVATDKARGVWKAPANVKIVDVAEPTIAIDDAEQEALNVDATGGKSIDAIRAFVGKGTLIWGARTLAGNDNEWRYVNIRRCCIFIETSIRRAARQFALEANDATTWSRVRGVVETFLVSLWRQGALMGVKTSDAFFVQVGLGTSMTQLDVSEGWMIVTIGLSLLRPAEFTVLRIVQTMPLP